MVRKNERDESRFETADAALKLATHTHVICSNPNIFKPIYSRIISRMISEATLIYQKVRVGNNINVKTLQQAKTRLRLQTEALETCDALITDIMISKGLFHLRMQKICYWCSLVERTQTLITKWQDSDIKRYEKMGMIWDVG